MTPTICRCETLLTGMAVVISWTVTVIDVTAAVGRTRQLLTALNTLYGTVQQFDSTSVPYGRPSVYNGPTAEPCLCDLYKSETDPQSNICNLCLAFWRRILFLILAHLYIKRE
jgi:hypothetical protein